MATKLSPTVRSVNSQMSRRYPDTFYDQYKQTKPRLRLFPNGRPWTGWREFAANQGHRDGFVDGELSKGRHAEEGETYVEITEDVWNAPFTPDQKFFEFNYVRNRITIRNDTMLSHDTTAVQNHYRAAAKLAALNGWKEVRMGEPLGFAITTLLGDVPRDPRIARACIAGDPWILGFTDEVNEELAVLLGLSSAGLPIARDEIVPMTTAAAVLDASQPALAAMMKQMEEMQATIARLTAPKKSHKKKEPAGV